MTPNSTTDEIVNVCHLPWHLGWYAGKRSNKRSVREKDLPARDLSITANQKKNIVAN